jgi:hypothetical protein
MMLDKAMPEERLTSSSRATGCVEINMLQRQFSLRPAVLATHSWKDMTPEMVTSVQPPNWLSPTDLARASA